MAWITRRETSRGGVRYDVGYRGPDRRTRRETFRKKADAERFMRTVEADIIRGSWIAPEAGRMTLTQFAAEWMESNPSLGARTRETYDGQLKNHVFPTLGAVPLSQLSPSMIRKWRSDLLGKPGIGPNTVAKCYRLLRTILKTAVEDEKIFRNPCVVKGAGLESYAERPVISVPELVDLASKVPSERILLVYLAAFAGLRLGELLALRRCHIDLLHERVVVEEATVELAHGQLLTKKPKTDAGTRTVHLDPATLAVLETHLTDHTLADPDSYVFTGAKGGPLRRAVWYREWVVAREAIGREDLHFHDLRHLGGTLVTQVGGTTREAMRRLGHSSEKAAMIYQHATDDRDRDNARAIGERIAADLKAAHEAQKPAVS